MTAIVAFVIMGGIKRIGQVAEFLAPVMCGIYFLITIIIIVLNIGKVPGMFGSIFASAFGKMRSLAESLVRQFPGESTWILFK